MQPVFERAYRAYQNGQWQKAKFDLADVLRKEPSNVAVLHLLGLCEKNLGNYALARNHMERAMQLAPNDAELAGNTGNLLGLMHEGKAALLAYNAAISLAPLRLDFRLNRAITALDTGLAAEATGDAAYLLQHAQTNARALSVAGQIYREVGDLDAAQSAFAAALALEPDRPVPLVALGELLLNQGDAAAVTLLAAAHNTLPKELGVALSYAEALELNGRFDEAISCLDRLTQKSPHWTAGHTSLARMRSEAGQSDDITAGFERAILDRPMDAVLWGNYAALLRSNDMASQALGVLSRAETALGFDPALALIAAGIADDMGDTARAAALLARVPANVPGSSLVSIRHAIRTGTPDAGAAIALAALETAPEDISLWALLSLCWRMLGDAKEAWLNPAPGLFKTYDIGFASDLGELTGTLRGLHIARHHPAGQSLRNGTQTRGSLFRRNDEALIALREHIRTAVQQYIRELPPEDSAHPLLRYRSQRMDFSGSWSVRLTDAGFHISHIHPAGIISSSFYIALPDSLGGERKDGWLAIGDAPPELATGLAPYAVIEPKAGRLALFPSYLFHSTRPFSKGERLIVAFDVAPRTAK
jgi:uncharacterized protein (TIGR02466 family)